MEIPALNFFNLINTGLENHGKINQYDVMKESSELESRDNNTWGLVYVKSCFKWITYLLFSLYSFTITIFIVHKKKEEEVEEEEKVRPRGKKGREEQRGYVIFLKVTQPGNDRLNTQSLTLGSES